MIHREDFNNVLSKEEVTQIVATHLGNIKFHINNFTVKSASENPMGFLGEHYIMEAEVQIDEKSEKTEKLSYFVKRIPTSVPQHLEYAIKTRAFFKEIELYKTLFVDLQKAQFKGQDIQPTQWCPKFFYSRESELFVLEDLSKAGYYMYPEKTLMDDNHLMASIRAMATMHSASLVFEEKFKEGKVKTSSPTWTQDLSIKENVTLGQIYNHLTFETEASDEIGHPGNTYHEAGIRSQIEVAKLLPNYSKEEKKKIEKELPNVLRRFLQLVKTSNKFKNVFVHGDLWANNIMFRKDNEGNVNDAIIIDFQLARYAPPAHDLMMFLYLVQDKTFRKTRKEEILRYYYKHFSEELKKYGMKADELLPWESFIESCTFYENLGLIGTLFYFQLILAPSHLTSKFLGSAEAFTQVMLVDRTDMVVECFLKDELFRKRVTEAMNDVIQKFILT